MEITVLVFASLFALTVSEILAPKKTAKIFEQELGATIAKYVSHSPREDEKKDR